MAEGSLHPVNEAVREKVARAIRETAMKTDITSWNVLADAAIAVIEAESAGRTIALQPFAESIQSSSPVRSSGSAPQNHEELRSPTTLGLPTKRECGVTTQDLGEPIGARSPQDKDHEALPCVCSCGCHAPTPERDTERLVEALRQVADVARTLVHAQAIAGDTLAEFDPERTA